MDQSQMTVKLQNVHNCDKTPR